MWSWHILQKPGFNTEMFRRIAKATGKLQLSKAGYMGGLVLDEMNIKKDNSLVDSEWTMVVLSDLDEGSNVIK